MKSVKWFAYAACIGMVATECHAAKPSPNLLAGARLQVLAIGSQVSKSTVKENGIEFDQVVERPCTKSTYQQTFRVKAGTKQESAVLALAGTLITSFAGKAVDAFVDWLQKRKERMNGTRAATYTGNFYTRAGGQPLARCVIFEAATFGNAGVDGPANVYIEFVPVYYDLGGFTLKPVYLNYDHTVAKAGNGEKFASLVISMKYNSPASTSVEGGPINASELTDGPTFAFNFGNLRPGAVLDYRALEGVNAGLGQAAPRFQDPSNDELFQEIAYQMDALWTETAEPSPLYTAAVTSVADNKDAISAEAAKLVRQILGIKDKDEESTAE